MREEQKLNKAIEKDGVDTQSDILDELKRRYPQYVEQAEEKRAPVSKRKKAYIFALAAAAVCAAIVVPCAVLLPDYGKNADNGGNNDIRYCTLNEYHKDEVEYTIREYRDENNSDFLYFDWYQFGEDCSTVCYISNSDDEVLCLEESIYLPQTDELVKLSITKENVYLDIYDSLIVNCNKKQTVNNHEVKWLIYKNDAYCIFEDGGYRYFIQIEQSEDENRLFELVAELLEK